MSFGRWFRKFLACLTAFVLGFASMPIDEFVMAYKAYAASRPHHAQNPRANVHRVHELKEKRTANSRTWKNSDLSETVEIYPQPIFYQEEGKKEWKEIDNRLTDQIRDASEKGNFKYQNKANRFSVFFSDRTDKDLFKIKQGKHWLSYSVTGAHPTEGKAKDNEITYAGILDNIDAKYLVRAESVKEDFILHKKPDVDVITFEIRTNLDVQLDEKNQIVKLVDKAGGKTVWQFEPPYMRDAGDRESHASTFELQKQNGKNLLILHLDQKFLNDPDTKYPVDLDPTVTLGGAINNTFDAYVAGVSGYTDNNYGGSTELRTGYAYSTGYTGDHRSYIKFGTSLPSLNGGLLVSGQFKAYKFTEPSSVDTTIYIHRPVADWTSSTITWDNKPAYTGNYGSLTLKAGAPNQWYTWDVTSLVDFWYDNPGSNYGLIMRAGNEGTVGSYRKFYSSDYSGGSYAPRLDVTYSPAPSAPTGTATGNGSGTSSGYVNLSWQSVPGATGYKVWIYNGKYYESIDVGNTTSWTSKGKKLWPTAAQIAQGAYTLRRDGSGTDLADDPRPVYTNAYNTNDPNHPQGTDYRNHLNYAFRVTAYNQYGETNLSSALVLTIDDQTNPTQPGTPTVSNAKTDQFTISWPAATDSISGVQKYRVYMGKTPGGVDVVNGAEVTGTSYTHPAALDPRTRYYFRVVAVDAKGNVSAPSNEGNGIARQQLDASIVSASVPTPLEVGQNYEVKITVKNEGIETWTASKNIMLGAINNPDHFTSNTRLSLDSGDSIATGQTKTFTVTFNGGSQPGLFNTKWKMLEVGTGWFGDTFSQDVSVLDTTPPDASIVINNGHTFTNSPNVTLTLKAKDLSSGAVSQKLKNESDPDYTPYEAYTPTRSWTLSSGNGQKTVSVIFKDASGNESAPASASIQLDTNYPTAQITSPAELQNINDTVEIWGTATDTDFKSYTVSYGAGVSPDTWTVIGTGSQPVNGGILAVWTPTGVPTGKYTIRLEVTDQAGNTTYEQQYVWVDHLVSRLGTQDYWAMEDIASFFGDSKVNLSNGNLVLSYTDAKLDGRQLDPSIERTYNSQDTAPSLLGRGWRLSVEASVTEQQNGDVLFQDGDGGQFLFTRNADGTYTPPKGVYLNLTKNADGTFTLADKDPNGVTHTFNQQGKLTVQADKNNNRLTYVYTNGQLTEMDDDVGRRIQFQYGANGLVSEIDTYSGNKIQYFYNANNLLTSVKYLDSNNNVYRTLQYEYNADNLLSKVTDPRGNAITYTYNGLRLADVANPHTSRDAATGNLNPTVTVHETFTYDLTNNQVDAVTSSPNLSQKVTYRLNTDGNPVETITDPNGLNIHESQVWQNNMLMQSTDGNGHTTTYEYDSMGNLTRKTEPTFTDIDGNRITPVTTYEYKPGTSLLIKETDPLGRVTTHDYDDKGNKILDVDVDGFKTTYQYDQYGNLIRQTSERGALYGYIPNFSFEEGDTSNLKSWTTTGSWTFDTANKKNGTRSVKLTGNASLETDYVPIKTGRLPVRGLAWVKLDSVAGTGVTGTVTFYDSNKVKIGETASQALTGTADWQLLHIAANVPANAAYVTYKIMAATTAGNVYVDSVWMEEANVTQQFNYSPDGLYMTSSVDAYGHQTTYEYDQAGNKIRETNALGQTAQWTYDADRKVIESIDRLGKKTTNTYDANGNLVKVINPLNQEVDYYYDEDNMQTMAVSPRVTKTMYNGLNPQTPEVVSISTVTQYDDLGQKVAEKDGNGNVSYLYYDAAGRVIKTRDPMKNEIRYTYDNNDNKIKEEDWAYDSVTDTLYQKGVTFYNYDEADHLVSYTDSSGNPANIVEKTKYDAAGNDIKTITNGLVKDFAYDKGDQPVYTKEESNPPVETWALPDGNGNQAIILTKDGASFNIYDENGNLLQAVNEEGKKTTYTYNEVGDRLSEVDANGTVTQWEYDAEGQLTKQTVTVTDPNSGQTKNEITLYQYDDSGQLSNETVAEQVGTDPLNVVKQGTYTYDELGQVTQELWTNASNQKTRTNYYYDNNGNTLHVWLYDETTPVDPAKDPDGDGYLNSQTDSVYDANNRMIQQTETYSGVSTVKNYTDKDDVETLTTPLGDTKVYYDKDDRAHEIVTPTGDDFQYTYSVDDKLTQITAPGVKTNLTYNGDRVATLKGVNQNGSGSTIVDLSYSYNDMMQITQLSGQINGTGTLKKYTYTQAGYLDTAEEFGKKLQYTHDANGNVTKITNLTTGKVKEDITYGSDDRIAQRKEYDDTTGSLLRTTTYTFNAEGALSQAATTEGSTNTTVNYTYNTDNELIGYVKKVNGSTQTSVGYEYDDNGNRIAKTVNGTRYEYQYDSNGDLFAITQSTGGSVSEVMNFFKDADGNLLSVRYNDVMYYYQFDGRGDVIAITDAAGNVKVSYDYDEYGNVVSMSGDQTLGQANPYRYVGRYGVLYDADANLYLMGWRDYDPSTGRFIERDVYDGEDDEPASQNHYLYAEGDPVNNIDPDGYSGSLWDSFVSGVKRVGNAIASGVKQVAHTVKSAAKKVVNIAKAAVKKVVHTVATAARKVVKHVVHAVRHVYHKAKALGRKLVRKARAAYHYVKSKYHQYVPKKIRKAIHSAAKKIARHAKAAYASIKREVKRQVKEAMEHPIRTAAFIAVGVLTDGIGDVALGALLEGSEGLAIAGEVGEEIAAIRSTTCRFGNCFTAGTLVDTINGEKPIEDITVGDKVLAKDPKTGKMAYKEVVRLFRHQVDELYEVHVNGKTIQTTAEHPFWVDHKGWVEAKDLKPGDRVVTEDGHLLPIEKVVRKKEHTTVYNFEVKDFHTYYVSGLHIWVHNMCAMADKGAIKNELADIGVKPLGRGSTGRATPNNLREQLYLKEVMTNPAAGKPVPLKKGMTDPRWPQQQGWVKMQQTRTFKNSDGTEERINIHYVYNTKTGEVDDFKFK